MGLLKGISPLISPDLLHVLASMGHGDGIVLADANFPAHSLCSKAGGPRYVCAAGVTITDLLPAVLQLFPVEAFCLMETADRQHAPVWKEYHDALKKHGAGDYLQTLERFQFYEDAGKAYAIVLTGERALYGNIMLTKGVISPDE